MFGAGTVTARPLDCPAKDGMDTEVLSVEAGLSRKARTLRITVGQAEADWLMGAKESR